MIENMDFNIGKILTILENLSIAENTIVFFTSDNGPEDGAGSTGSFKGRKRLLSEGGIRVPAIVQWKGTVAPGSKTDKFAISTDLFPTLLEACSIAVPAHVRLDGVSVLPVFLSNGDNSNYNDNNGAADKKNKATVVAINYDLKNNNNKNKVVEKFGNKKIILEGL
jgi:arylsulfatase A